jgi:hypothetical protein
MYVDLQQFAAVLLPRESVIFHPDGNSPGKYMENSGKQNPKMGFKSPPEQRGNIGLTTKNYKSGRNPSRRQP